MPWNVENSSKKIHKHSPAQRTLLTVKHVKKIEISDLAGTTVGLYHWDGLTSLLLPIGLGLGDHHHVLLAVHFHVKHALPLLVQLDLRKLRHTARHSGTDQTDEAFCACCSKCNQQETIESLLPISASIRGMIDQTEAKELDTDHSGDQRDDGECGEAEYLRKKDDFHSIMKTVCFNRIP